MADGTMLMVQYIECSRLNHGICCTLSSTCFHPCSKLATIFQYGLIGDSASQNVFFVSSVHVQFEKRKGEEAFH